jgi:hypothetical protein
MASGLRYFNELRTWSAVAPSDLNPAISVSDISNLTVISNYLNADVLLNNTAAYFDGPSCAQGTSGIWFAVGSVTLIGTIADGMFCKLWDGTTVIDSTAINIPTAGGAGASTRVSFSGFITAPAGNIKISVRDNNNTNGKIQFNISGFSMDSGLTVLRVG